MTTDEAWKVLSGLNPVMADGHLTVLFPGGTAAEIQRHLKSGGRLFPYAVYITDGAIFVRSRVDGSATPLAGKRIDTIEGVPADEVVEKLLAHMNGDTPALRAEFLSDRFACWYWTFLGERRSFRLRIGGAESVTEASGDTPSAYREKTFERLFRIELLAGNAALLAIDEFYWSDKPHRACVRTRRHAHADRRHPRQSWRRRRRLVRGRHAVHRHEVVSQRLMACAARSAGSRRAEEGSRAVAGPSCAGAECKANRPPRQRQEACIAESAGALRGAGRFRYSLHTAISISTPTQQ